MIVKLMADDSSAADPLAVPMSDYSRYTVQHIVVTAVDYGICSIDSSGGDYTDEEPGADNYFLFQVLFCSEKASLLVFPPVLNLRAMMPVNLVTSKCACGRVTKLC